MVGGMGSGLGDLHMKTIWRVVCCLQELVSPSRVSKPSKYKKSEWKIWLIYRLTKIFSILSFLAAYSMNGFFLSSAFYASVEMIIWYIKNYYGEFHCFILKCYINLVFLGKLHLVMVYCPFNILQDLNC